MANKKFGEINSYCPNGFIDQDVQHNGEWWEIVKDDSGLIPLSRNCSNIHGMQKLCKICFVITLINPKGQ